MDETNAPPGALGDVPVDGWTARARPGRVVLEGRVARLEPLDPTRHAEALFAAYTADPTGGMWRYLSVGPFDGLAAYRAWAEKVARADDPVTFAIVDQASGTPVGTAAYMRIEPGQGVIEVGSLTFSPTLQRTTAATEAMYLMARHAFDDLGYRRYEWKCNAANLPSRAAARRLGFTFEGVFRNHMVVKGRNRDTAWYSITEGEWPLVRRALEAWLASSNFNADGRQIKGLAAIRRDMEMQGQETRT